MSNILNTKNRHRTQQMIKVEKESKNLKLRKRLISSTEDKNLRKETVWDRLSRVRKTPKSSDNLTLKCKRSISSKTSQRVRPFQPQHQTFECHARPKSMIVPKIANSGVACKSIKPLKEILTARSLRNSKSSFDDYQLTCSKQSSDYSPIPYQHQQHLTTPNRKTVSNSEDSDDEYKSAASMSWRSQNSTDASFIPNFDNILQDPEKALECDATPPLWDKENPQIFKDILKAQLEDMLKYETCAVKEGLDKIDCLDSPRSCLEGESIQSNDHIFECAQSLEDTKRLEVDVVFKNIPSLEKEIIILRTLGEKLENTLKQTSCKRNLHLFTQQSIALNTGPSLLNILQTSRPSAPVKMITYSYILGLEIYAKCSSFSRGIVRVTGVVREFRIERKTIVELKQEANRPFYIPIDPESAKLKKTSFEKLKGHPDLLIRHIKATNSSVPFNILDHDPIFFNNILFNGNVPTYHPPVKDETPKEEGTESKQYSEGKSNRKFQEKLSTNRKNSNRKISTATDRKLTKSITVMSPMRGKEQRLLVRRSITPITLDKTLISPKNTLFKTILVGTVQISCFMLLIMAFTFPAAKC